MAKSKFLKARISGVCTAVPEYIKSIDNEIGMYGGDVKQINRIKKTIGLNQRHVAGDKTTASDLCEYAAINLFQQCNIKREEIDGLIMVTQTPDYYQPFTAAVIHQRLKLSKDCAAFDVNLGCSGYVYGLWMAHMMIESGTCSNVLLLAGDTLSKCVNPRDRSVAPLFGDAGSATLVQLSHMDNPTYFALHTDGDGFRNIIIPSGGFRQPKSPMTNEEILCDDGNYRSQENLHMNGAEVFNFSIKEEPASILEILKYAEIKQDEIDYIVFHQANKYIISNISRRLGFSLSKAPSETVEKYGNQSSASIPATICYSLKEKVSNSSVRVILSGFGVGLSWASCLTMLSNITCSEIIIYKEDMKK